MVTEDPEKTKRPEPEGTTTPLPLLETGSAPAATPFFGGSAPTPTHPERIGPYRILKRLGEGGMGVVYLAEQVEPIRRQVALKLIIGGADSGDVVRRFEAERQTLALMNHPNIARVYDAGATEDGRPYFVMEYVEGGLHLTEYCDSSGLSVRERLELFGQVCAAVGHAHQRGIIHRDLKPSNILVTILDGKAVPKIIDFGIAKAIHPGLREKAFVTETGQVIGTLEYMSPEQTELGTLDIDTRTDIYSLGAILYELLVGTLPIESETLRAAGLYGVLKMIRELEPLRPSLRLAKMGARAATVAQRRRTDVQSLRRLLREDLDWITMKALEKDRALRYAGASELAEDLRRHLDNEPVIARPPTLVYRSKKFARRHRWQVLTAAGVIILLTGIWIAARYLQVFGSRELLAQGERSFQRFLEQSKQKKALREIWEDSRSLYQTWQPVWEREKETEAWNRLLDVKEKAERSINEALVFLYRAKEKAPKGSLEESAARRALGEIFMGRWQEALEEGSVSLQPAFFEEMVRTQGTKDQAEKMTERGKVALQTDPPGAEVYCFRYEKYEERLLPLPFHPQPGRLAPEDRLPFLRIEEVLEESKCPFRAGDRLLLVRGKEVRLPGDLARALAGLGADESVEATILRSRERRSVQWVPFPKEKYAKGGLSPPLQPGRLIDIYYQFGLLFEGYPLDLQDGRGLGVTPVELELPPGSYILVLRKEGYPDTRYPLVIPGGEESPKVRLFKESEIPEGFIYLPAGSFSCGGDPDAYESLEIDAPHVNGFFMKRLEVTFREYLVFVNDSEIKGRLNSEGKAVHLVDWEEPVLKSLLPEDDEDEEVELIPRRGAVPLLELDEVSGDWKPTKKIYIELDWPVFGLPMLAGVEYAHWLTGKHGGRWRFRLPAELEWEKAARGVDRRIHVWGEYLVKNFCRSLGSPNWRTRGPTIDIVGFCPTDESVYGIRDLAGSVSEPNFARATPEFRFYTYRGGNPDATDFRDFRIATRNRALSWNAIRFIGLRLVADLPADSR